MVIQDVTVQLVALFGGIQVVLTGLTAFLGRVWVSRIRDREVAAFTERLELVKTDLAAATKRLEAVLDHSVYMQKVHFETEFKIYSDLWPRLRTLRDASRDLSFDSREKEKPLDARRATLNDALEQLRNAVEDQRPFFAANIAAELFELLDLAKKEDQRDAYDRALHPDRRIIHASGMRNIVTMSRACERVCELIRTRITGSAVALDRAGAVPERPEA
jgi:hypothetical protein